MSCTVLGTGKNKTYHLSGSIHAQTLITAKRFTAKHDNIWRILKKILSYVVSIKISERMFLELGILEPRTPDILPNPT